MGCRAFQVVRVSLSPSKIKFKLIDNVIEQTDTRIVAIKTVTSAEEYLGDHFPSFPVLPGVMMIEALVQAGRRLAAVKTGDPRYVLGEVKALRYGSFVRPGEALQVEVTILKENDGQLKCKGEGKVIRIGENTPADSLETAVSGRFTLRPLRLLT